MFPTKWNRNFSNYRGETLDLLVPVRGALRCTPVGLRDGYRRQLVPIALTSGPLNQPPCRDSWRATSRLPPPPPAPSLLYHSTSPVTRFPARVSSLLHPLSSPSYDSFGSDLLHDPFTPPTSTYRSRQSTIRTYQDCVCHFFELSIFPPRRRSFLQRYSTREWQRFDSSRRAARCSINSQIPKFSTAD